MERYSKVVKTELREKVDGGKKVAKMAKEHGINDMRYAHHITKTQQLLKS